MNNRETIFITRKAEDQPAWPEKTGVYSASCAPGQNHRKSELNGKLWAAAHLLILQCNTEGDYNLRIKDRLRNG